MKRAFVALGTVCLAALIVFTLVNNKAKRDLKARNRFMKAFPVTVCRVEKRSVDQQLTQVGVIVADNDVPVAAELQGRVTQVFVKEGSFVSAGAPLVKLEDEVQEANFLAAQNNYLKAQKDLERYESLHREQLISDVQLESARLAFKTAEAQYIAAQKQYRNSTVVSPISGIVASRPVDVGAMVNVGTVVAEVVDTSRFKAKVYVGEDYAFRLRVGDPVRIETDVYPGVKFSGRIDNIGVKGDETHNYPVQVVIPNGNRRYPLKSGMFGKFTFSLEKREGLVIPRVALAGSIKNPQVFVVRGGIARLRPILIDFENGTDIVVEQGVKEGDSVVISGQENLQDKAKVFVIPAGGAGGAVAGRPRADMPGKGRRW